MSDNLAYVLVMFMLWGWIPVLSIEKAISWIVASAKSNNECSIKDSIEE